MLNEDYKDMLRALRRFGTPLHDFPHAHDAVLRIYSARKGERLLNAKLPADPVFEGLAAADGRLFVSLKNGRLVCYGK